MDNNLPRVTTEVLDGLLLLRITLLDYILEFVNLGNIVLDQPRDVGNSTVDVLVLVNALVALGDIRPVLIRQRLDHVIDRLDLGIESHLRNKCMYSIIVAHLHRDNFDMLMIADQVPCRDLIGRICFDPVQDNM